MYQFLKQAVLNIFNRNKSDFYVVDELVDAKICDEISEEIKNQCSNPEVSKITQSGGGDQRIFNFKSKKYQAFLNSIALTHCPKDSWFAFAMVNWLDGAMASDGSGEGWHRDSWFGQRKLLIYLTDCNSENGPFQYIANSNNLFSKIKYVLSGETDRIKKEPDKSKIKTFNAKKGTAICFDATGAHRGKPPISGERIAITFYYFSNSYNRKSVFSKFN